jgi:DNA-binding IclR family transcriptional regulator
MTDDHAEGVAGPRSVLRVLDILSVLAARPDGWTLTEIASDLALPKTSAFSLLKTLEAGGYLRRGNGKYLLGAAAHKLGTTIANSLSFPRCARPVLEDLARQTGETVMLGVLSEQGHEVAYVDIIESDAALRFTVRVGNRRPLYAAASGKAILAFLPEPVRKAYLAETHFIQFTAETSGKAALIRLLPDIRRHGVVLDTNGIVDAASAIASPCFDDAEQVSCSVSIAGPTGRIVARQAEFERLCCAAGEEISRILGYQGPYPPA